MGSGQLTATIWKSGSPEDGWEYRFNIVRTNGRTGRVIQRFSPADLFDLAKLVQVLAFALADDGCVAAHVRSMLQDLWLRLDRAVGASAATEPPLNSESKPFADAGEP